MILIAKILGLLAAGTIIAFFACRFGYNRKLTQFKDGRRHPSFEDELRKFKSGVLFHIQLVQNMDNYRIVTVRRYDTGRPIRPLSVNLYEMSFATPFTNGKYVTTGDPKEPLEPAVQP